MIMPDSFEFSDTSNPQTDFVELDGGQPVPGATAQFLSFDFCSDGFFAHAALAHFAIGIRGRIPRDEHGRPRAVVGRGFIIGHTHLVLPDPERPGHGGCRCHAELPDGQRPGMAQIESYWEGGNFLHAGSCRPAEGLVDGVNYRFELEVTESALIRLGLGRAGADRLDQVTAADGHHPVPSHLTGLWIGLASGPKNRGPWRARFSNVRYGWRAGQV